MSILMAVLLLGTVPAHSQRESADKALQELDREAAKHEKSGQPAPVTAVENPAPPPTRPSASADIGWSRNPAADDSGEGDSVKLKGMTPYHDPSYYGIIGVPFAADQAAVKGKTDLERAKLVFAAVGKSFVDDGIPANDGLLKRAEMGVRAGDPKVGTCNYLSDRLEQAFKAAGIDCFAVTVDADTYNKADVNRNHIAMAVVYEGKVYFFDHWEQGRGGHGFMDGDTTEWNAMPADEWGKRMKAQGYVKFSYEDGTYRTTLEEALADPIQAWEMKRRLAEKNKDADATPPVLPQAEAPKPAAVPADPPAVVQCAKAEQEHHDKAVAWFPKIHDKDAFSHWSCQPMHSAQESPSKACCDAYYGIRNEKGMWDKAWDVLQECGWKDEIAKRKAAYDKKLAECRAQENKP